MNLDKKNKLSNILPSVFVAIVIISFSFSLFKNISYPLLWNDETDAAMWSTRIMEFGYPKVHDGKNKVFLVYAPNMKMGYKKEHDAYIYITWGGYYFAVIGEFLSKFTNDIYVKTALMRIPFALAGFIGIILMVLSIKDFFLQNRTLLWLAIIFGIFEILSISLVLHMREVRYFSLVIFFTGILFFIFFRFQLLNKMSLIAYSIAMTILLFLTFNTNFIVFAIFVGTIGFYQFILFLFQFKNGKSFDKKSGNTESWKVRIINLFIQYIPLFISILLAIPLISYFEIIESSAELSKFKNFNLNLYFSNLSSVLKYFTKLEYLYLAIVVKIILLLTFLTVKKSISEKPTKNKENEIVITKIPFTINYKIMVSNFMLLFILIYALINCRLPYFYVRHFIVLQPVMSLMMVLDIFIVFQIFNENVKKTSITFSKALISFVIIIAFAVNTGNKLKYINLHLYELTHQYKGVLDYIIPYIKENYKNPEKLTIATNYEELAYMFYLKSKTTIGFIKNNLEEDKKYQPDIIIYRRGWGWQNDQNIFNDFFQKAKYKPIQFPVVDFYVNNMPEINEKDPVTHQFKTLTTNDPNQMMTIYVKED
ncbi:MAG: hypothetical protein SFY32_03855 [Bacteroidota bacterium]|nr:hypothetical protein [Bacteroidota bacterium]